MSIVFSNFFTHFCDFLYNYDFFSAFNYFLTHDHQLNTENEVSYYLI